MAKVFDCITDDLKKFIADQQMFFVASAPLTATGHINVSPKGLDSFRVLSDRRVAYLDLTGSGNETSAHLIENGRITLMFCAFQGSPMILRLYGTGQVVLPDTPAWAELISWFTPLPGARQIVVADIERVQTSCGFGVPLYDTVDQRRMLLDWASKKGQEGLKEYHMQKNMVSVDGLPTPIAIAMQESSD